VRPTRYLLAGDARQLPLASASVQCVVTSPPYWGLRDYGVAGQLGLELTPELYVQHLVEIFREVRRVLRADGTCWLNLGDSFATTNGASRSGTKVQGLREAQFGHAYGNHVDAERLKAHIRPTYGGLKPKDLVGMPWRVAFALQADGWWLRSDIIWAKPNPMPESITDRPTKSHEYLFLLTKAARYYYDGEAIKESLTDASLERGYKGGPSIKGNGDRPYFSTREYIPAGRNRRSVWTIATEPYPDAHFATFPEKLVEPCILAGTSERGACPACWAPWARDVKGERRPWAELAQALSAARMSAGLTREEVAARADIPSAASVRDWEEGGHVPSAAHWHRLAAILSLPLERQAFLFDAREKWTTYARQE
jgi:DNA modification methylase